jgi:TPR repeat protein
MKRVEANDPVALREEGKRRFKKGDYKSAFEYFSKAAELGDISAHNHLSFMSCEGQGVEKDEKKELYHLEEAAIGGDDLARFSLGYLELKNGRHERAFKHFIIAANLGHDDSLNYIREGYKMGLVCKEDFAAALRGHQAAVDATKSPQRAVAEAAMRN